MHMKEIFGKINHDQVLRDEIIWKKCPTYMSGLASFKDLTLEKLEKLIEHNFVDLNESQNNSPTILEFYEFMKKYPCMKAHGYTVDRIRSDYRVSIEGIRRRSYSIIRDKMRLDFMLLCKDANELRCTEHELYSWWD